MYCPNCGSTNVKLERWETCQDCGAVFKILNTGRKIRIEDVTWADPRNRAYPIMNKHDIMESMERIMRNYYNNWFNRECIYGEERITYLKRIHDRILERAIKLDIDIHSPYFHHDCPWCDKHD